MSGLRFPQQRLHVEERHDLLIGTVDGVSKQPRCTCGKQPKTDDEQTHCTPAVRCGFMVCGRIWPLDGRFDPR